MTSKRLNFPSIALAAAILALPVFFVALPLIGFLAYSFFKVQGGNVVVGLFADNYVRFFTDPVFTSVLLSTVVLCAAVAISCVLVAYPVAYFLSVQTGTWRYVLLMLLMVPLLMSYVIKIYAIRSILGYKGMLNNLLMSIGVLTEPSNIFVFNLNAVILTLSVLLIPFAILPIFLVLERIPRNLTAASFDLGASRVTTFVRISLPLSLPGVVSAASFVFVLAIGDFLTPQMVGGTTGFTFGRIIYSQFGTAFNWPFGAALSIFLGLTIVAVLSLSRIATRSLEVR